MSTASAILGIFIGAIVMLVCILTFDYHLCSSGDDKRPDSVKKAEQERDNKWYEHYIYFLTLGFDKKTAHEKATTKMRAEAEAAEKI